MLGTCFCRLCASSSVLPVIVKPSCSKNSFDPLHEAGTSVCTSVMWRCREYWMALLTSCFPMPFRLYSGRTLRSMQVPSLGSIVLEHSPTSLSSTYARKCPFSS